ncbi:MAG TPA: hypothetical protein ENI97_11450 [Gammaproteobacteria bacterium]|nr:hypothetical protein [Gammaproteobacteria bacterium]
MIFGFNTSAPLLDEASEAWLFDVFHWLHTHCPVARPATETGLVFPDNAHFPGRETSIEGMAALIFSQVKSYAGIDSLPTQLLDEQGEGRVLPGNDQEQSPSLPDATPPLTFHYHSHTLNDPQVLIASFAHQIAFQRLSRLSEPPPGGDENRPHTAELLAVCMGFGVIMANTANTRKIRSCGSCSGPAVERESFLSQYDMTYALAVDAALHGLSVNTATCQLKNSLRPFYKKVHKTLGRAQLPAGRQLAALQQTFSPSMSKG